MYKIRENLVVGLLYPFSHAARTITGPTFKTGKKATRLVNRAAEESFSRQITTEKLHTQKKLGARGGGGGGGTTLFQKIHSE